MIKIHYAGDRLIKGLLACEYSGKVRDAFTRKGFDVTSCDLLPTDAPGKHYQGDVYDILYQDWDFIIAHPPCTYLTNAGVRWLYEDRKAQSKADRWLEMVRARNFFLDLLDHKTCKYIGVENPIPHKHAQLPPYTQTIQPYDFYPHTTSKRTCLWLKGFPPLVGNQVIEKSQRTYEIHNATPGPDRWKIRSTTYDGIANAMADQWGAFLMEQFKQAA